MSPTKRPSVLHAIICCGQGQVELPAPAPPKKFRPPHRDVPKQHVFLDDAKNYNWEKVKAAIEAEPSLINVQPSKDGELRWSALHLASESGSKEMVEWLLLHGADPTLLTNDTKMPKDVAKTPEIKDLLMSWMIPDNEPNMALVGELGMRLRQSGQDLKESLPKYEKFDLVPPSTVLPPDESTGGVFLELSKLVGATKGAALFRKIADIFTEAALRGRESPHGMRLFIDFEDFPVQQHVQLNLTNPFFASTVSHQNQRFFQRNGISTGGVGAKGPEGDVILIPGIGGGLVITNLPGMPGELNTFFQRICESLGPQYPRFCIDFMQLPNAFKTAKFYRMSPDGFQELKDMTLEQKEDIVDTTWLFQAECIHTVIHIFHYVLVGLLAEVCKTDANLSFLLKLYEPNIRLKHNQVQNLLLSHAEDLVGPGILVGRSFDADRNLLRHVLSDFLTELGRCKSAAALMELFYPQVLHDELSSLLRVAKKPAEFQFDMPPPGMPPVLADLKEQVDLIPGFAEEVSKIFDKDGRVSEKLQAASSTLGCGRFRVGSLKQWIELMSISGLIHGTTLTMTRLFFTPQGLSCANFVKTGAQTTSSDGLRSAEKDFEVPSRFGSKFTEKDFEITAVAFATITGLQEHREVFPDLKSIKPELKSTGIESEKLDEVLPIFEKFHHKSNGLKEARLAYYKEVLGEEEFAARGWMFSDYFPSGVMNQATLTTYL